MSHPVHAIPRLRAVCLLAVAIAISVVTTACYVSSPPQAAGAATPPLATQLEAESQAQVGSFSLPTALPASDDASALLPTPTPEASRPEIAATFALEPTVASPETAQAQSEPTPFPVGNDLTIEALRNREIVGSDIVIEQTLAPGANYSQYIASYQSEGYKIYALLTVPNGQAPEDGYPAIVFNHGYIPPQIYRTTERYVAYVDALARAGFVVFKIDMRGFGNSEGEPSGAYFSPDYTIDAISALKSLQRLDYVNPEAIGMWGHSMAGNLVLRAMLVEPDVKAGVVWSGAVYSYDDMVKYAIDDPSFRREEQPGVVRRGTQLRETYGPPDTSLPYWRAVSLTENIEYLDAPLQIHHAVNDPVVNIGYSRDLAQVLDETGKAYELYEYAGGGHNIESPYFSQAMTRTIEFFREHL